MKLPKFLKNLLGLTALEEKIFRLETENDELILSVEDKDDRILELENQVSEARTLLEEDTQSKTNPQKVFEVLFKTPPSWYKFDELTPPEQKRYYQHAQAIVDNPVFKNEMDYMIAETMKEISYRSPDHDTTRALRFSINGLKAFQERLVSIPAPQDPIINNDPLSEF